MSLMYYTFMLDDELSWYCVLVTPFGKFCHLQVPMGMMQSLDWAQGAIKEVLKPLLHHNIRVYIDDVSCFTAAIKPEPWTAHLQLHDQVLNFLKANKFSIILKKCALAVQETSWLGYWVTPNDIKPGKAEI